MESDVDDKKMRDWRYRIMEYSGSELMDRIKALHREVIIEWLQWNDSNGIYSDKDSVQEFGEPLTKNQAMSYMYCQIMEIPFEGYDADYLSMKRYNL